MILNLNTNQIEAGVNPVDNLLFQITNSVVDGLFSKLVDAYMDGRYESFVANYPGDEREAFWQFVHLMKLGEV
jgi:hypothetical protein